MEDYPPGRIKEEVSFPEIGPDYLVSDPEEPEYPSQENEKGKTIIVITSAEEIVLPKIRSRDVGYVR
jgi:hypothetical protein